MSNRDVIVIGASVGGVEALQQTARALPADLPAAVFVVLHIHPESTSLLPEILSRSGALDATHPRDGERIESGRIYVAPPDHHLLLEPGYVRVVKGPKENRHRPAVDPLFRSAARVYGPRTIGVVLTGGMDDGAAGLLAIKRRGGLSVVQDPQDALCPEMPKAAIAALKSVDYIVRLSDISVLLNSLARERAPDSLEPAPAELVIENGFAQMKGLDMKEVDKLGTPSAFTCPECQGALWELHDGDLMRFRCHVGHAYSADNLEAAQSQVVETALWAALRSLEENITLARRMAVRARERNNPVSATSYEEKAAALDAHAAVIHRLLSQERQPAGTTRTPHSPEAKH